MFDYTMAMDGLIRHIVCVCPDFSHIRPDELIVSYIQTKSPGTHGIYASVQPLRFKNGERTMVQRGKPYNMPRVVRQGREILYIIYFALPRFANLQFEAKLTTVFHELYHISPEFNGDIRRFKGRMYAHGGSRKQFNEMVSRYAQEYLALPGAEEHASFLRLNFDELCNQFGGVVGNRIRPPKPKLVRVDNRQS